MEYVEFTQLQGVGQRQDAVFALLFEIRDLLRGDKPKPKEEKKEKEATKVRPVEKQEIKPSTTEDPLLDTAPTQKVKQVLKQTKKSAKKGRYSK